MRLTNRLGLPQPFVDAATREHTYTPKRYSVTQILKGTREAILLRRHDDEIERDVSEMVWLIFGTAVHSILEDAQETDTQLKENKIAVDMPNGYVLSGIFDLYDDATKTVTDYKTASAWKAVFGDWSDYKEQLLAYTWMLRQIGFDARYGEIVALLKDHSKTKAKTDYGYPNYPVETVRFAFPDKDLKSFEERLYAKFNEIERCEKLPDDELPLCTPAERWHKDDQWAVVKAGNKKASKLFTDEAAAEKYASQLQEDTGKKCRVDFRPGVDQKCLEYCDARPFCSYGKQLEVSSGN